MAGIELDEQESALVVQALSLVRMSDDFTAEEQLMLKQVAEKIAESSPPAEGTSNGAEKSD